MVSSGRPFSRRTLLAGLGASAAAELAGCRVTSPVTNTSTPSATTSPLPTTSTNPFGVHANSTVELWTDSTWYPSGWTGTLTSAAGREANALDVTVHATEQLATDLADAFSGGTPPDAVLSGGPDPLALGQLASQLTDLSTLLDARVGTGATLRSRLRTGVLTPTTLAGRVVALPTVWTVHGLWFSAAYFKQQGWEAPTTWDELAVLGRSAKAKGHQLFGWGRETATWFQRMVMASAVKQGGETVRKAFDDLDPACWSQAAVQDALGLMRSLVTGGMVRSGGAARPWREALGSWSKDHSVLFVPAGSWITAQSGVAEDFLVDVVPDPVLDTSAAMPTAAAHVQGEQVWVVPQHAANQPGGLELVRLATGRQQAAAFCTTNQVLSTLTDAAPSTTTHAVQRQEALLSAAGKHVFALGAVEAYGTNHDFQALWNAFLSGTIDVATLTKESQRITNLVRADSTIAKL